MNNIAQQIHQTAFREYDIRALIGTEMPIAQVYPLTKAIITYFLKLDPTFKSIAVGMDGRIHSAAIADHVCSACTDSGIDVSFLGTCPTPALYFAMHTLPVQAGIMITASHNPKEYNGLKLCLGTECLWGSHIKAIRDLYYNGSTLESLNKGIMHHEPLVEKYIESLVARFEHLRGISCSALIDCGNGTAGVIWPTLIKKLNLKNIHLLYQEVDGTFPNHEADPTIAANMHGLKELLHSSPYQLGIGLDGDCDRMLPMTKDGTLIPGDKVIALFSKEILKNHPHAAVVCDIKSSESIIKVMTKWGIRTVISRTGHSIIKQVMHTEKALLGGELSGHFTFKDRYLGFDDGCYAALRLIELLHQNNTTLEQELDIFPQTYASPEIRIACPELQSQKIVSELHTYLAARPHYQLNMLDGIRFSAPHGWGIVRPSNTQPILSIRFESETSEGLEHMRHEFFDLLKPYFETNQLKKELGV